MTLEIQVLVCDRHKNVYRVNYEITNLNRHNFLPIVKYAINYGFQRNIYLYFFLNRLLKLTNKQKNLEIDTISKQCCTLNSEP